jgi:hypothetical protein
MSQRVKELVEAGLVLSHAGDKEGALRLVEEALRLDPGDPSANELANDLGGIDPAALATPFEPPPPDLFADAPARHLDNPFARPPVPSTMGAPQVATPTQPAGVNAVRATPVTPFAANEPMGIEFSPFELQARVVGAPGKATPKTDPAGQVKTTPKTDPSGQSLGPSIPAPHVMTSSPQSVPLLEATPEPAWPKPGLHPRALQVTETPSRQALHPTTLPAGVPLKPATPGPLPQVSGRRPPSVPPSPPSEDPLDLIDSGKIPRPPSGGDTTPEGMLHTARGLLAFADHSGALGVLDKLLTRWPDNAEAQQLRLSCENTLLGMFESKLGDLSRRPALKLRPDEVIWLNLDHRAGFVLAQIDGSVSLEDLFALSGMSRLDTARILAQLLEERVIGF